MRTGRNIILVLAVALVIGLIGVCAVAHGQEVPATAIPVGIQTLPCDAAMVFYDTNNTPDDGAEFVVVIANDETTPRVVIEYGVGDAGQFKSARVTIPGKAPQVFKDSDTLTDAYPHPCAPIMEEVGQKT